MRAASALAIAVAGLALAGCARKPPADDPARMALLNASYAHLHERLEKAAASEPLVASAFAARGQVVLAMRAGLIEELAGNVARHYLDRVSLDLSQVEGHGSGELRKKTFLGRIKIGDWRVSIELGSLMGDLRVGTPHVGLRGPDLIDVELPVDVQETEGDGTLRFGWDSAGIVNAVCKDFELTRQIRGHVRRQRHLLSGSLRIENTGDSLTVTPVFSDRRFQLKLDLTPASWSVVEAGLRSQDTFGKCGMLMDPDQGLARLKELAATGIWVSLPDSVFRTVSLPARLHTSVTVNQRTLGLRLKAEGLRIENATLWSSASVQVQTEHVRTDRRH